MGAFLCDDLQTPARGTRTHTCTRRVKKQLIYEATGSLAPLYTVFLPLPDPPAPPRPHPHSPPPALTAFLDMCLTLRLAGVVGLPPSLYCCPAGRANTGEAGEKVMLAQRQKKKGSYAEDP